MSDNPPSSNSCKMSICQRLPLFLPVIIVNIVLTVHFKEKFIQRSWIYFRKYFFFLQVKLSLKLLRAHVSLTHRLSPTIIMAAISYWRVPRQTLFRFEERGKLAGQECLGKCLQKKITDIESKTSGWSKFHTISFVWVLPKVFPPTQ